MAEHTIKITNMAEFPSGDPVRRSKSDLMVSYTFDEAGPFVLVIEKESFGEIEFKKRVMEQQKLRLEWLNREIKVTR